MRSVVKSLIAQGKVKQTSLSTVRLKLLTACSWQCGFCHQEGNPDATGVRLDAELERVLAQSRDELGMTEVHLSGGEPTLHKEIVGIVQLVKQLGLEPKLTSNGQSPLHIYDQVIAAGVKEVNLSVHTLNPVQLGMIMLPKRSQEWGEVALARQMDLIAHLLTNHPDVAVKVNTVVSRETSQAIGLLGMAKQNGLKLRLMNDLALGEVSYRALKQIVDEVGAVPDTVKMIAGSSSFSVAYQLEDFRFAVKLIRANILPSLCGGCDKLAQSECVEYFYGLRLEYHNGLQFRLCLHRQGSPAVLRPSEFFSSPQAAELKREIQRVVVL